MSFALLIPPVVHKTTHSVIKETVLKYIFTYLHILEFPSFNRTNAGVFLTFSLLFLLPECN